MKLHRIVTSNLNSLYGEHVIDLDDDLNDSLFLILGPTGAGKSTILDAVCLALFGVTPRLTRSTGRDETDTTHIMSYGTGRCRAEVTFSIREPEGGRSRYRAVWDVRRAYEKPSGNMQDPERSLFKIHEDGEEEVLTSDSRKKYYGPAFEEVLRGMTVEDFQRSILLAQGEFAAFLKADEEVKASILERLTNTDEYQAIGERAANKRRAVKKELERLEERREGLDLLSAEEEAELHEELAELEAALDATRKDFEKAQRACAWLEEMDKLTKDLASADEELTAKQEALEQRAEDRDRLRADRACRDAQQPLRQWEEKTARVEQISEELPKRQEELDAAKAALDTAREDAKAAKQARAEAREANEQARPEIERARNLKEKIEGATQEFERVAERRDKFTEEIEKKSSTLDDLSAKVTDLSEARDDAKEDFAEVEHAEGVLAHLEALAAQLDYYTQARAKVDRAKDERASAREASESARTKLEETEHKHKEVRAKLEPLEQEVAEATDALEALLDGEESPAARRAILEERIEEVRASLSAIEEALRLHDELVRKRAKQAELKRSLSERASKIEELDKNKVAYAEQREALEQRRARLRTRLRNIDRLLVLSDKRKELRDGEECPLCGSHDHPYMEEEHVDEFEANLETERDELLADKASVEDDFAQLKAQIHEVELEIATQESTLTSEEHTRRELREEVLALVGRYDGARHRAQCDAVERFPGKSAEQQELRDALVEKRGAQQLVIKRTQDALKGLESAQTKREQAQEALRAKRKASEELEITRAELASRDELLKDSVEKAETTLKEARREKEEAYTNIHDRFHEAGIEVEPDEQGHVDFAGALERARDLKETFEARREAVKEASKSYEEAMTAKESASQELTRLKVTLEEVTEECDEREATLKDLKTERAEVLDGKDPDAVATELQAAVQETEEAYTQADKAERAASSEYERLAAALEEYRHQLTEATEATEDARAALDAALAAIDIEDVEHLRAQLLSPEERAELEEKIDALTRAKESAQAEHDRLARHIEEHTQQRPEEIDIEARNLEQWTSERDRLQTEVEGHLSERGVLQERIDHQKKLKKQAAKLIEDIESQRGEYNVWHTIHSLIGTSDGEAFKQFAQSLNLQELVDRANIRLERLAPRYSLSVATGEQGEPKLDFAVCDHHQANATRPLTTLSGGETFLVSLALALGLADFRRVEMPVETLLLDEGFGTLDQETLDVAMSTLRQLQQESIHQIGLISHVEALRERIDSRIIVEKLGNGRSTLQADNGGVRRSLAQ